jgi:hypothetical protein
MNGVGIGIALPRIRLAALTWEERIPEDNHQTGLTVRCAVAVGIVMPTSCNAPFVVRADRLMRAALLAFDV